jgi:hypothetical protein
MKVVGCQPYALATLKTIYYAKFHTLMECGIIFWGNSSSNKKIFQMQKEIVRIRTGTAPRTSFKPLFRTVEILTMPSQYILSLMTFLVNNLEHFTFKTYIHKINTRRSVQL